MAMYVVTIATTGVRNAFKYVTTAGVFGCMVANATTVAHIGKSRGVTKDGRMRREEEMPTLKEKTARLKAATEKVQEFVNRGGDIKSPEAAPLGMELILAANEVGKDLGYEILKKKEDDEPKFVKDFEG
jgi:hypothetical protein